MRYDIATKAQAMTLKVFGASNQEIENITGIKQRTMAYIYERAVQRGFDPNAEHPTLRDYHFAEAPRSGRPRKDESKDGVDDKANEKESPNTSDQVHLDAGSGIGDEAGLL